MEVDRAPTAGTPLFGQSPKVSLCHQGESWRFASPSLREGDRMRLNEWS